MSRPEERIPQPVDEDDQLVAPTGSLDAEGIPDHEGPLASKEMTGDGQEGIVAPGDRPWASEGDDVTAAGQREGSTLDERLALEEPDRPVVTGEIAGLEIVDEDRPDDEPDLVGGLADAGEGASAEELAMHVRDDAPGGTDDGDDGYVAEDGGMAP
jgi:hypothetical protein